MGGMSGIGAKVVGGRVETEVRKGHNRRLGDADVCINDHTRLVGSLCLLL